MSTRMFPLRRLRYENIGAVKIKTHTHSLIEKEKTGGHAHTVRDSCATQLLNVAEAANATACQRAY